MSGHGYLLQAINKKSSYKTDLPLLTVGRVVATNDPQQMGRVKVICPALGDYDTGEYDAVPWALNISPLAGIVNSGTRGTNESSVTGPVAYGMWNIPKKGAYVLVGCLDGDVNHRVYIGCVQPQYMTHTTPHGRYLWKDGKPPEGPLDTTEQPIEPLYQNLTNQFTATSNPYGQPTGNSPRMNYEWCTRGADYQTSALTRLHLSHQYDTPGSGVADHEWGEFQSFTEGNGNTRTSGGVGYGVNQQDSEQPEGTGGIDYDSLIYSWTTPGFHSISMDDHPDNSRVRIRTTSGHQILLDDTNERIYVSPAGGETWIEIDKCGNIDIFASKDVSTHARGDINFTAGKTFRVKAEEGIHFTTPQTFRVHANDSVDVVTDSNMSFKAGDSYNLKTSQDVKIESGGEYHVKAATTLNMQSLGPINYLATDNIVMTGSMIHMNGPQAASASPSGDAKYAYITTRIPDHEPWARVYSDPASADQDTTVNTFVSKPTSYDDPTIGKQDRDGVTIPRGPKWHR